MKRNGLFVKKRIVDSLYLLPVGQMVADLNRGIKINPTCEYVWEQLSDDITYNELIKRCAHKYDAEGVEIEHLEKDIEELIKALKDRGMIKGSRNIFKCGCRRCLNGISVSKPMFCEIREAGGLKPSDSIPFYGQYLIGGLPVEMYGSKGYFAEEFEDFRITGSGKNNLRIPQSIIPMRVEVIDISDVPEKNPDYYDFKQDDFRTLIHHPDLTVLEDIKEYVLFFTELEGVEELHMKKDGSLARFYCQSASENVRFGLFHAIRMAFLMYALEYERVMLHSCSILYKDKVWAFSAPSGTGKSTHCGLWEKLYKTPVINGDLNLIGVEDGKVYVYGTPWCGSSGISDTGTRQLGGIILLRRGQDNFIEELSEEQKILYVQQRLITSVWDENSLDRVLDIVKDIIKRIYVKRYYCTKEDSAAEVIHEDILKI